jgi:glycosyltransferase involved in cell wall biosynthesis
MGGVEFTTLYLAGVLPETGMRCLVICPEEGELPERCRAVGVRVHIAPRPRIFSTSVQVGKRYLPNPLAWSLGIAGTVLAAARLARQLRKLRVDLVCTKGLPAHFYGGLAAKLADIPCVWHVQDLVSDRAGGLYRWVLGLGARLFARQVISDGTPIQRQLLPYLPAGMVKLIYNGVDTDLFSPGLSGREVRAEWGIKDTELLIGNVARLTAWKGQDHLIRAFANLGREYPEARLVLVGAPVFDSNAYERELRRLVRNLGLSDRVIFAGFRWDLARVLAAMDIYAHASVEKDTSPVSVVSAMSSGKPIVAAAVEGVAELFPRGSAEIVAAGDADALAEGLRSLLRDPARRVVLGQSARGLAEQELSLGQFADRCAAVFQEALSGRVYARWATRQTRLAQPSAPGRDMVGN